MQLQFQNKKILLHDQKRRTARGLWPVLSRGEGEGVPPVLVLAWGTGGDTPVLVLAWGRGRGVAGEGGIANLGPDWCTLSILQWTN